MPRPKPTTQPIQVLVRLHPEIIKLIDGERTKSDLSRPAWIAGVVASYLAALEQKRMTPNPRKLVSEAAAATIRRARIQQDAGLPIGPAKPALGSRLKKR